MSVFSTRQFTCPDCEAALEFDNYDSINADRRPDLRPDLREDILAGSLSFVHCEACDKDFKPEPNLNYLDHKNGIWVMAQPIYDMVRWDSEEQKARTLFVEAYGENAPRPRAKLGMTSSLGLLLVGRLFVKSWC